MNTDTIINFFLLRVTTKMTYKKYGVKEVNPIGVLVCFIGFIGTAILSLIIIIDSGILDYKPKTN